MTGRVRLPFGFANTTRRVGSTVVKEYEGRAARDRLLTEVAALNDVADLLPVPRIVEATEDPPVVRMAFVEGAPASARLSESHPTESRPADDVLHRMGVVLRDFQTAYRKRTGRVRVHGDYGPNNVLLRSDGSVAAVIDWEWSRFGDPLTDAAWMEWALRIHYPGVSPAAFYDGYGHRPPWAARHLSMMDAVAWRAERAITDPVTWQQRLDATARLEDA